MQGIVLVTSNTRYSASFLQNIVQQQFGAKQPDLLSEDFQFIFPVVGPLTKKEFTEAFSSFKVEDAFTGSYNYFGFNVDPMEPNRVWFFSRGVVTHSGVLYFGAMKMKPTGKTVVVPPQVLSMSFNTEGLCYKLTGGYSVDRTVGNTGGLGGVFGLIHAIGGRKSDTEIYFVYFIFFQALFHSLRESHGSHHSGGIYSLIIFLLWSRYGGEENKTVAVVHYILVKPAREAFKKYLQKTYGIFHM